MGIRLKTDCYFVDACLQTGFTCDPETLIGTIVQTTLHKQPRTFTSVICPGLMFYSSVSPDVSSAVSSVESSDASAVSASVSEVSDASSFISRME